jgi:hypothetical protein
MTWEQVYRMREMWENKEAKTIAEIARVFGLAYSQTREILRKESWWPVLEERVNG